HDLVTNNSRLTCKTAGLYLVYTTINWVANATGFRMGEIYQNGTTGLARMIKPCPAEDSLLHSSTVASLAVNDYVEVRVWQNSGDALNIDGASFIEMLHFGMQRIG
ncbi:unnamed protein product, partial [marine sediment metagenome]